MTLRLALAFAAGLLMGPPAMAQTPPNVPTAAERHPGIVVEAFVLSASDGAKLRAVATKPQGAAGRLPAVLYLQPLSCDTVAVPAQPGDGWEMMLQRLVRESGALVLRVEKRGVGGSEGDCASLDYETELADHRAALQALRTRPDVDPRRIVVFGGSMGSNYAPLVAADQDLAGVAVWGGGARTWAERTLAFERNRSELGKNDPTARAADMAAKYRFIGRWLIDGRSPEQIAAEDPELGAVWPRLAGTSATGMYGRPLAFHQQAHRQNWPAAWTRVRAPVLVTFGALDWFEDESGVRLIGDIVNGARPGQARVVVFPNYDHHFARHADRRSAFSSRGTPDAGPFMHVLLPWLKERFSSAG